MNNKQNHYVPTVSPIHVVTHNVQFFPPPENNVVYERPHVNKSKYTKWVCITLITIIGIGAFFYMLVAIFRGKLT